MTFPDAKLSQTPAAPSTATWMTAVKHDWIENGDRVTLTIYAKRVPKDSVEAEFSGQRCKVTFRCPDAKLLQSCSASRARPGP